MAMNCCCPDILGTDENVIYSKMEEEVNYHLLYKALSRLSPREKTIIQLRFGIRTSDGQEKTQKEVAGSPLVFLNLTFPGWRRRSSDD